jgi:hypothetical protein
MSNPGILHLRICEEGGFDDFDFLFLPKQFKKFLLDQHVWAEMVAQIIAMAGTRLTPQF